MERSLPESQSHELTPDEERAHLGRAAELAGMGIEDIVLPGQEHIILRRMRFHYLDWGNPEAHPIVFLHGGGLNAHTYDLTCLALRAEYRCIALDLRGHGDSEWSPVMEYGLEAQAGDVDALVAHLGLRRPIIVGMSLGGLIAMTYAGTHAAELAALVLIDIGPDIQSAGARRIRDFMAQPSELDSVDEYVARAKAFNPLRDEQLLRRSLRHNLRRTPGGKWTWKYDARHRARPGTDADGRQARAERLWRAVPAITCPTLVVRGARSDIFSAENAEALTSRLPRGRLVTVAGAGHTVQGDAPAALVRAIRGFLVEGVDRA